MRFLEEYQNVNLQNSDAIVEYEERVRLITGLLAIKKFDGLNTYSLLDLLNAKARIQTCLTACHQMECILNRDFTVRHEDCVDFVGDHDYVLVCMKCSECRHGRRWSDCGTCGDPWAWEGRAEHLRSASQLSV